MCEGGSITVSSRLLDRFGQLQHKATLATFVLVFTLIASQISIFPSNVVALSQPAGNAAHLGATQEAFEERWGPPNDSAQTEGGQVLLRFDLVEIGRTTLVFEQDSLIFVRIYSNRPTDKNLTEPEEADWTLDEAEEIARSFLPEDAQDTGDPQMSPAGALFTSCQSDVLASLLIERGVEGLTESDPNACQFGLYQNRERGVYAISVEVGNELAKPQWEGPVRPIPAGETRPRGSLVVLRLVDHAAQTIDVSWAILGQETIFGPSGMNAVDGWEGYETLSIAHRDACGEARARLTGSQTPGSWDTGYTVTFFGGEVPDFCV